jgi:hypothetical protein
MPASNASTVTEYLDSLPPERRKVIATVRSAIKRVLPKGYKETMNWGAITYEIPLSRYPTTYNGQPLCYVGLSAQKNYYSLYLLGAYSDPEQLAALKNAFKTAGKKLDMGKSCVRFKSLDDLPLDALGDIIAGMPPETYIERYEASRRKTK